MKLSKTLLIALITLFIALPCTAMEIDDEPDYDIAEVDTTRLDKEYLRQIYETAPEGIKIIIAIGNIQEISKYYKDEDFAKALSMFYKNMITELANEYPNLKFRIGTITNQTDQILGINLSQLIEKELIWATKNNLLDSNQSTNLGYTIQGYPSGQPLIRGTATFLNSRKNYFIEIYVRPVENEKILVMLYTHRSGGEKKLTAKAIFSIKPHNYIYDINIVFGGEQLSDSKIEVSAPFDIFEAVRALDYDELKEIIKMLGNILIQDKYGNTPLHYAALNDWSDPKTEQIFGYLLSVNPQLLTITNNEGETPLSLAPIEIREKIQDLIEGKYVEKEE